MAKNFGRPPSERRYQWYCTVGQRDGSRKYPTFVGRNFSMNESVSARDLVQERLRLFDAYSKRVRGAGVVISGGRGDRVSAGVVQEFAVR